MSRTSKTIKNLSVDDRPREKMLSKGKEALSNAELLAILLSSGTKEMNAVQLAQYILSTAKNNVAQLARFSLLELQTFPGIGPAKAVTISAALELGRRRQLETANEAIIIKDSSTAYRIIEPYLSDLDREEFWVLFLDQKSSVIQKKRFSIGGINSTVVDSRLIFKEALLCNATSIILAHNHPSGNLKPSKHDISLTANLMEAGKVMNIRVSDHIIVTPNNYTSLLDEGYI